MSTQPDTKCEPDIFENGREILVLVGCSTAIEAIVVRVRELLQIKLDWHYVGGRGVILTTEEDGAKDEQIREHIKMEMPRVLT